MGGAKLSHSLPVPYGRQTLLAEVPQNRFPIVIVAARKRSPVPSDDQAPPRLITNPIEGDRDFPIPMLHPLQVIQLVPEVMEILDFHPGLWKRLPKRKETIQVPFIFR